MRIMIMACVGKKKKGVPWRYHIPGEARAELNLGVCREMAGAWEPCLRVHLAIQGSMDHMYIQVRQLSAMGFH